MAAELWDYESRLETTTRTDGGAFDQVIALSQGVINENFKKLYDMYSELHTVYFKDQTVGTISGTIDAPQILIPGGDKPSENLKDVLFQIRFLSGEMKNPDGTVDIPNLKGWTFSVFVPVVPETLPDPKDITDPADRSAVEKKLEKIKSNFEYPGNYSVERLYVKLSSADWDKLDYDTSFAGFDPNTNVQKPFLTWQTEQAKKGNPYAAMRLKFWLEMWANKEEESGHNSIGLSFKNLAQAKSTASFVPVSLVHQVYPYRSAKNNCPEGRTGFDNAGNCNCLLYLEMVERGGQRPKDRRLIWSGNMATQPRSAGDTGIRGTYLLNREIFMDKFLLPELRALNRACDIVHQRPSFYIADDKKSHVRLYYGVGSDPMVRTDSDGTYDFQPVSDPQNPRRVTAYTWTKVNKEPKDVTYVEEYQKSDETDCWGRAWTEDKMKTDVTWVAGTNEVHVKGECTSSENVIWTDWGSKDFDKADNSHIKDVYTATWNITMRLIPTIEEVPGTDGKSQASFLHLEVDAGPNDSAYATVPPPKKDQLSVTMHGHDTQLEQYMKDRMAEQIPRVIQNIREKLKVAGRFSYPGNGKLIFERPVVGKYGDLNAEVRYQELSKEEWITVPTLGPIQGETPVKDKITQITVTPAVTDLKLSWTSNTLVSLTKRGVLKLKAANNTNQTIRFIAISFQFPAGIRQECLFSTKEYKVKEEETAAPPESSAPKDKPAVAPLPSEVSAKDQNITKAVPKVPPPQPTFGQIQLLHSPDLSKCKVTASVASKDKGVDRWQVEVSATDANSAMSVPAGAWLEINITADVGVAAKRELKVDESFSNDKGQSDGHFMKPVVVLVS